MLDIQKMIGSPKIIVDEKDAQTAVFEVQYLPRWFAHTMGNAMRRMMLWYDIGGAVTGMKLVWITHEYQVIDGMKETVLEFLLNLKKLRFRIEESMETVTMTKHTISGMWVVNAEKLSFETWIELLNPDQYLCEITDPSLTLELTLRVERWYGYYSLDFLQVREKEADEQEVDLILIDNDFRIVEYVKYEVENVIEDLVWATKDILRLEIKTAFPKVSPKDLMTFSWEVLASYFKLFIFEDAYIDKSVFVEYEDLWSAPSAHAEEVSIKVMPIDALPLSERTRNALIKNEILYVEDLEKKKKGELLLMKWVWRKAIDEINTALTNIDKTLAG